MWLVSRKVGPTFWMLSSRVSLAYVFSVSFFQETSALSKFIATVRFYFLNFEPILLCHPGVTTSWLGWMNPWTAHGCWHLCDNCISAPDCVSSVQQLCRAAEMIAKLITAERTKAEKDGNNHTWPPFNSTSFKVFASLCSRAKFVASPVHNREAGALS